MVRVYCESCRRHALVVQDVKQCCGERADENPGRIKRMSEPESRRRLPGMADRQVILESQNFRCLYCDVAFDGYVYFRGQFKKVKLNWDHMAPYAYSMDNKHQNFAAACQFCNSWKGGLIFKTVDEVRIYVAAKWEKERGEGRELRERGVLDAVPSKTEMAEVLQSEMPVPRLGPPEPAPVETKKPREQHRQLSKPIIGHPDLPPKNCQRCSIEFTPTRRWQEYCGANCRRSRWFETNYVRRAEVTK